VCDFTVAFYEMKDGWDALQISMYGL